MRSSTQMMPNLPSFSSMMSLDVMAVRHPSFLTKPRLYTNSRTDLRLGVPQVMWGSQILSMLMVALLSLTKTPLLICRRRKSWRAFLTLGATWLTPRMRMTKAYLSSPETWKEPSALAWRLSLMDSRSTSRYSLAYLSALLKMSTRLALRAALSARAAFCLSALAAA